MSGAGAVIFAGWPNPVGWVIDKVSDFVGGVATAGFEALIGGLAAWVTDAVVWVIGGVFNFFIDSTDPNVQADWFVAEDGPYGTMVAIGAGLLLLFLLAGITQGVLAGDVGGMLRRVALDLPVSVLGMVGLVTVTQALIRLTDELSTFVMGNFEDDIADFTAVVTSLSRLAGGGATALVVVLLGLVTVLAGLILVTELAVRSALIYIVVALAPLVFAVRLWPSLEGVAKRSLQLLVALILSKLAMAVALAVAASSAVGAGSGGEVTALPPPEVFAEDPGGSVTQAVGILLAAVAAFGVAAFSPLLVSRLLPLAEAAVVAQGIRGMPVRGGTQAASMAYYSQGLTGVRLQRLAQGGARGRRRRPGRWGRHHQDPPPRRGRDRPAAAARRRLPALAAGAGVFYRPDGGRSRTSQTQPPVPLVSGRWHGPLALRARPPPGLEPDPRARRGAVWRLAPPDPRARRWRAVWRRRRCGPPWWQRNAPSLMSPTAVRLGAVGVAEERLYQLEPLDASGVFLGLGVVQCGLLGGGIFVAVAAISAGVPVLVAAIPGVGAAVLSLARVGGHPAWEWLPLGSAWVWSGFTRGRRWAPPLPLWPVDAERPPPLPPCLAGLEVIEVPWRAGGELAAVHDAVRHALTAVVPVRGAQFLLEARADQERLVAGWGEVLSQFATEGGTVAHICWSDLVRPSGLQRHTEALPERPGGTPHPAAQASYRALLEERAPPATSHDVVVSITVTAERLRRRHGGSREERLGDALGIAVEGLLRALGSVGLEATDPLDVMGLWRMVRLHVDPTGGGSGRGRRRLGERLGLVTPASAGPLMLETDWRAIHLDAVWQRTWWVASWPRLAVPPAWLEPFLSPTGVTRTITVAMVPVSTYRSRRRIERDLVKLESDATVKEEKGRRIDARHQRATQALLEREREIVAGFAEMGYVGLVTVSARSEDELEEHAEIVEQRAHEAGMDLRVLDGRQDVAWAGGLPLGLAPATVLAT